MLANAKQKILLLANLPHISVSAPFPPSHVLAFISHAPRSVAMWVPLPLGSRRGPQGGIYRVSGEEWGIRAQRCRSNCTCVRVPRIFKHAEKLLRLSTFCPARPLHHCWLQNWVSCSCSVPVRSIHAHKLGQWRCQSAHKNHNQLTMPTVKCLHINLLPPFIPIPSALFYTNTEFTFRFGFRARLGHRQALCSPSQVGVIHFRRLPLLLTPFPLSTWFCCAFPMCKSEKKLTTSSPWKTSKQWKTLPAHF